ncbi:cilia- and flagella-associated protein 418 isoform X2 [Tiliqua scincoides]|uniref:cilia- and flagella-associated protein 418 isoform X2 n=1 Tax=Tiliqua scincoides TaxID=71010 RepID=UPI00346251C9
MADDLDDLLDEVESRFCRLPGPDGPHGVRGAPQGSKSRLRDEDRKAQDAAAARGSKVLTKDVHEEEDIDEIIKDIIDENSFAKNPVKPFLKSPNPAFENNTANNIASIQARGKRCCPVYLGGSTAPYGVGTNISQRTCDQLRCTGCDFHVSHFNDYQWDRSCDYLFFRNNMPEFGKLRTKMLKKKGTRAYACQCSWRSIDELTDLSMDRQLHWITKQ